MVSLSLGCGHLSSNDGGGGAPAAPRAYRFAGASAPQGPPSPRHDRAAGRPSRRHTGAPKPGARHHGRGTRRHPEAQALLRGRGGTTEAPTRRHHGRRWQHGGREVQVGTCSYGGLPIRSHSFRARTAATPAHARRAPVACTLRSCPPTPALHLRARPTTVSVDRGHGAYHDQVTLSPPRPTNIPGRRHHRPSTPRCSPALPSATRQCDRRLRHHKLDIVAPNVQGAAMATLRSNGRDTRPSDGSVFIFERNDSALPRRLSTAPAPPPAPTSPRHPRLIETLPPRSTQLQDPTSQRPLIHSARHTGGGRSERGADGGTRCLLCRSSSRTSKQPECTRV